MSYLDDKRLYDDPASGRFLKLMTVIALIAFIGVALEGTFLIVIAMLKYGWGGPL